MKQKLFLIFISTFFSILLKINAYPKYDFEIAKDERKNFTKVKEAIDAVPWRPYSNVVFLRCKLPV